MSFLERALGAPTTPTMNRGDDDEASTTGADVSVGRGEREPVTATDSHGGGNPGETTTDISTMDDKDWDIEIFNHVLVQVLGKNELDANATDDFNRFLVREAIDDVRLLMTLDEEDYKSMGFNIDFPTFRLLQALNKRYNEEIDASTPETTERMWFFDQTKNKTMRYMLRDRQVTKLPGAGVIQTPVATLGRPDSNKAKLEEARRSSLALFQSGRPPLAPTPTSVRRVTFGGATAAPSMTTNPTAANPSTTVAPAAATASTYVYSRAQEFDKGGRRSSSDYGKFQSREQWPKWHRALMGNAYEHKCEQVLDPSYSPDPNDSDEVELFKSQQRFMYSVFSKTL